MQRGALAAAAHDFRRASRAHFGTKLASMTPLTLADHDRAPMAPSVRQSFAALLVLTAPAVLGVLAALALTSCTLRRC